MTSPTWSTMPSLSVVPSGLVTLTASLLIAGLANGTIAVPKSKASPSPDNERGGSCPQTAAMLTGVPLGWPLLSADVLETIIAPVRSWSPSAPENRTVSSTIRSEFKALTDSL